jgi:2,3-oxidosqualene cyclase
MGRAPGSTGVNIQAPLGAGAVLERGVHDLLARQRANGCWEGEMVWCTMILSQYIIVQRALGRSFDSETRGAMVKYFQVSRTPEGVWGLHPESGGYLFFTTLAYIALRLLDTGPDDPMIATARRWLHAQEGGVLAIPSWGKFWLALLDLYGYEGVNPVPPEMFLLPKALPFQPHNYYCHTRLIYLAMSYLYGARARAHLGPIVNELRKELYDQPYETVDFSAHRHRLARTDVYMRPSRWLRFGYDSLQQFERVNPSIVRRRALDRCFRLIEAEQKATRYQALSPVNGLLNCLAMWSRDPNSPELAASLEAIEKWKWQDEDEGIRYTGARSQTWDTAFAMMALMENAPTGAGSTSALRRAYGFLRDVQMTSEVAGYDEQGRDPAIGGWCFSDGEHRWPVSDCTAEALCAVLKMHHMPDGVAESQRISEERIGQAAAFILSRQNADGGFGTYERRRGSSWLERVNPSEMFGQCMTERSYVECTGSALSALAHVRESYPALLRSQIDRAIDRGTRFLRSRQRSDGSYAAFWGINFTYALFHVVKGLRAVGVASTDSGLRKIAEWLMLKQRTDGGWGEHYSGCLEDRYVEHSESQVVMTSWALLALMELVPVDAPAVMRGISWLQSMQCPDGSWPQQSLNGVFFGAAMLDYRLYKSYFPVWALARYTALQ